MTQSRDSLISLTDTPYYHCISRCVRRAFLCGEDQFSGQSFEHRRQWVIDRIRFLTDVFSIEVCAYSIMSNHYHLVLYVNEKELAACTDNDICMRWGQIYSLPDIVVCWQKGEGSDIQNEAALAVIAQWRTRLSSISWFMRCLNEFIARKANKEDDCKGRYWEGRFKSQALLDEKALLTCMAYVDLNPVRAKMHDSVESSEYTSIFERVNGKSHYEEKNSSVAHRPLVKFCDTKQLVQSQVIPFTQSDYRELLDWTGRMICDDKRGSLSTPALLEGLDLDDTTWLTLANDFGKTYHGAVGSLKELATFAEHTGKRWIAGKRQLDQIYH